MFKRGFLFARTQMAIRRIYQCRCPKWQGRIKHWGPVPSHQQVAFCENQYLNLNIFCNAP